jgi:hypothetical protein
MERRGEVRHPARFAQQVVHAGWNGVLPRKITPSDIDVVFDNKLLARTLFCEFSCVAALWRDKEYGQQCLYQQLLKTNNYRNGSVLCYHRIPVEKNVNSFTDVISFHVMRANRGFVYFLPSETETFPGTIWVDFVKSFYDLENNWGVW